MITRRALLGGALPALAPGPAAAGPTDASMGGLQAIAATRGITFGTAVPSAALNEPDALVAICRECGLVVGESAQKWNVMWPQRRHQRPALADLLAAFADDCDLALRGHTLVWHWDLPPWAERLRERDVRAVMRRRIAFAAGRYAGRMSSWDVVNEAIRLEDGRPDGLRDTLFLRALGPGYIAEAFRLARAADPQALLVYNDYGIEAATAAHRAKRRAVLALLDRLLAEGAPVGGLGIQAHIWAAMPLDIAEWQDFLAAVAGRGLAILVTEFDVNDGGLPRDIAARDAAVAAAGGRFLAATLAEPAVATVLTWCLSDRHTHMRRWPQPWHRQPGDGPARPLPLDDAMARKPLWYAMAEAFAGARQR